MVFTSFSDGKAVQIKHLIYPLKNNGFSGGTESTYTTKYIPVLHRALIRSKTPREFAENLFNRKAKTLIRAIGKLCPLTRPNLSLIFLAKVVYDLGWPIDKVVQLLEARFNRANVESYFDYLNLTEGLNKKVINYNRIYWKSFLRNFSPDKVINTYINAKQDFFSVLFDSVKQYRVLKQDNYTINISQVDIHRAHDVLSFYYRKRKEEFTFLPIIDIYYELKGRKIGDYYIDFPLSNFELKQIGEQLDNCVASYSMDIKDKDFPCYIMVLKNKNNIAMYCIAINPNNCSVVQFRGKRNSHPPVKLIDDLNLLLMEEFIKTDKYKNYKCIYNQDKKYPDIFNYKKDYNVEVEKKIINI